MPDLLKTLPLVAALAAPLALLAGAPAGAQEVPRITVTPSGPGGSGYYGEFGRDLPGVYMLSQSGLPVTPDIDRLTPPGGGGDMIVNRYSYQNPLPTLDAWHGTMGPGLFQF